MAGGIWPVAHHKGRRSFFLTSLGVPFFRHTAWGGSRLANPGCVRRLAGRCVPRPLCQKAWTQQKTSSLERATPQGGDKGDIGCKAPGLFLEPNNTECNPLLGLLQDRDALEPKFAIYKDTCTLREHGMQHSMVEPVGGKWKTTTP
eukprot:10068378-Lingulodinium_polyedra.AAC.1